MKQQKLDLEPAAQLSVPQLQTMFSEPPKNQGAGSVHDKNNCRDDESLVVYL